MQREYKAEVPKPAIIIDPYGNIKLSLTSFVISCTTLKTTKATMETAVSDISFEPSSLGGEGQMISITSTPAGTRSRCNVI
jgi:hypothetical protein